MFVRRAALEALGSFNPAFGRGYGEENDFCRRAAKAGWRNVLCDDAYVAHRGGASFGPIGLKPGGENLDLLNCLHPEYAELVSACIARDPLRPIRERILAQL